MDTLRNESSSSRRFRIGLWISVAAISIICSATVAWMGHASRAEAATGANTPNTRWEYATLTLSDLEQAMVNLDKVRELPAALEKLQKDKGPLDPEYVKAYEEWVKGAGSIDETLSLMYTDPSRRGVVKGVGELGEFLKAPRPADQKLEDVRIADILNFLGGEGWEVVSTAESSIRSDAGGWVRTQTRWLMKRPAK